MAVAEAKKALLIGNNDYDFVRSLKGSLKDVQSMAKMLGFHENGDPNFHISEHKNLCNYRIQQEITQFLNEARATNSALIYFAGHGTVDGNTGYICGTNVQKGNPGVSMKWLVDKINQSGIQFVTLILDCCHAGAILNDLGNSGQHEKPRQGFSILAATTKMDVAGEFREHGVFTAQLEKGLAGAAKDQQGFVNAMNLYQYTSDSLNPFQQQPIFHSTTLKVYPLRQCLNGAENKLTQQLAGENFFRSKDDLLLLSGVIPSEPGPEMERYLTLSFFESAGYLDINDKTTLIEAFESGSSCKLSPLGKDMWAQIQKLNAPK